MVLTLLYLGACSLSPSYMNMNRLVCGSSQFLASEGSVLKGIIAGDGDVVLCIYTNDQLYLLTYINCDDTTSYHGYIVHEKYHNSRISNFNE